MINRINLLLRAKNITARTFAEEIGIQPSGMSHILSGRNNPSLDFVTKVLRRYPEISTDWLIFGQGEMLKSSEVRSAHESISPTLQQQPTFDQLHPTPTETDLFSNIDSDPTTEDISKVFSYPEEPEGPVDAANPAESTLLAAHMTSHGKRISKIVFFYDDHTFESWEN